MKRHAICLLAVAAVTFGHAAFAETVYVSDSFTVPVRSGPSAGHRIVHRGLPTGTELTVIERDDDAGFVHVRTTRGTQGWIAAQYLVRQPIARVRLDQANRRIERLEQDLSSQKQRVGTLEKDRNEARGNSDDLSTQVSSLQAELDELQRISSNAVASHERNIELEELVRRLRTELDELTDERNRLERDERRRWLMYGGGLVLGGLLLGVAIKARPRRSAWS